MNGDQLWFVKSKTSDCTWKGAKICIEAGHLKIFDALGRCTAAFAPGGWLFVLEDEIAESDGADDSELTGRAIQ